MAVANCGGLKFNKESLKVSNNILTLKDNTSVGDSFVAPMCGGLLLDSNVFAPYRVDGKNVIGMTGAEPTDYIKANCSLLVDKDSFEINENGELVCVGGASDKGLKFVANTAGSTVCLKKQGSPTTINLEYSVDNGENWTEYALNSIITLYNVGDNVLFRGDNLNGFSSSSFSYYYFVLSGSIGAYNSITYLIDKTGKRTDIPSVSCYDSMFTNCTSLTQAPELPATNLTDNCYNSMFRGCTSLTQAPELPATNLTDNCYNSMFRGCTSLTQAPELPATTLADHCYASMFRDCTSLNYIKINYIDSLPTSNSATWSWLANTSATGDAYFNGTVTDGGTDDSIPSGWTIHTF